MSAARLRRAFQAGLTALLACLLTSALFAAPVLAVEHDYGHSHPEGTPHHVHTLDAVLGTGVLSAPLVTPFALEAERAPAIPSPERAELRRRTPHHSRAPPTV